MKIHDFYQQVLCFKFGIIGHLITTAVSFDYENECSANNDHDFCFLFVCENCICIYFCFFVCFSIMTGKL